MSLRIIGAALPRTGTLSLKFALEILGLGRCYHMSELICDPSPRWRWAFARWKPSLLDPLWADYSATLDAPACNLWQQLAARFPEAKVILTRRDAARWYESVMETVAHPKHAKLILRSPLAPAALANPPFGWRLERTAMIEHFERYGERVRENIAPERLLIFEAKGGWEPLCAFLGLPVPQMPFPHVNDRDTMLSLAGDLENFEDVQRATRHFLSAQRQSLLRL